MEFFQYLLNSLNEITGNLGRGSETRLSLRMTVLCEAALENGDVSLEIINLMHQARRLLSVALEDQRSFCPYEPPAVTEQGRRGRPKFAISEQQLAFSKVGSFPVSEF